MTTRDRYQNPILGDTVRLRDYVYTSQTQAAVPLITKVEIYKQGERLTDLEFNPLGLTLKQVNVNHMVEGVWDEIQPYPAGAAYPDYYFTDVETDDETWTDGSYADKWYLIFDEDITLENYTAYEKTAVNQADDEIGLVQRTFYISPEYGHVITPSAIHEQVSVTDLTLTAIAEQIVDDVPGWPEPPVGLLDVVSTSIVTRVGQIVDGAYTSYDGWIRCDTDDGETWTCTIFSPTGAGVSSTIASATMEKVSTGNSHQYKLVVTWSQNLSSDAYLEAWYVDQWNIDGVAYDSSQPNPWDDAWDRSSTYRRTISSHNFNISASVYFTSPRPVIYDFNFVPIQIRRTLGSRGYISTRVSPAVSSSEVEQYYRQFIEMSDATYKIYRQSFDSSVPDKLVDEGIVNYREGQDLFVYVDATKDPFLIAGHYYAQYTLSWREISTVSNKLAWILE